MSGRSPDWSSLIDWNSLSDSGSRRIDVDGRACLLKWRRRAPHMPGWPPFFEAEARGLALLAATNAVNVPEVLDYDAGEGAMPAYIVMEWIERESVRHASLLDRRSPGEVLGRQLAALHRLSSDTYGLDHGNYCGDTPQDNHWSNSWIEFYGLRRLGFQMDLAGQRGLIPRHRRQRLERLIGQLDRWIDESACRPSLVHGDLWGGNWLVDSGGRPVLIDPAVYYGDREAELAMCRLFGGFPPEFYRAYDEAWPPTSGRDDRTPLYQLYHLLNHLNLFGEGYGGQVDSILARYSR